MMITLLSELSPLSTSGELSGGGGLFLVVLFGVGLRFFGDVCLSTELTRRPLFNNGGGGGIVGDFFAGEKSRRRAAPLVGLDFP